jgi:hypothetical protein
LLQQAAPRSLDTPAPWEQRESWIQAASKRARATLRAVEVMPNMRMAMMVPT